MAERVGFEPTVPVRVRRFSRPFRYDRFGISPINIRYITIRKHGCQGVYLIKEKKFIFFSIIFCESVKKVLVTLFLIFVGDKMNTELKNASERIV